MPFTYDWYEKLIFVARQNYTLKDWGDKSDGIIIRHDIDYDLHKAYEFASFEQELGVKSTYFLLLTGDFYNVFSHNSQKCIQGIVKAGHKIGLHFDETRYVGESEKNCFIGKIEWEAGILSEVVGKKVQAVSMHRPSERMLNWDLEIPDMFNTYSKEFFSNYKYFSDSRRRWREPIIEALGEKKYKNIQVLIHPFWYGGKESDIHNTVSSFVNFANLERYDYLNDNITNLNEIMTRGEVR